MEKTNYTISFSPAADAVDVDLPASKSISNRALTIAAMADGCSIGNIADCDDTNAIRRALLTQSAQANVNIGAAGTAMRFLTAYFASQPWRSVLLDGTPRMRKRPIGELVEALRLCGADIDYYTSEGYPPLWIEGRHLKADAPLRMRGNVSSQYVSAMMMIAPMMKGGLTIEIEGGLTSRPYVEMTAALMRHFGAEVTVGESTIVIEGKPYSPSSLTVESDWSAASYWYEIKALCPDLDIRLNGLQSDSLQGDSRVAEYFKLFGVTTEYTDNGVALGFCDADRDATLNIDLSSQPDIAQTIVVTACLTGRPHRWTAHAAHKGDRPSRGAACPTRPTRIQHRDCRRQHSFLGRRSRRSRRPPADSHLRRPPDGNGFRPGCNTLPLTDGARRRSGVEVISRLLAASRTGRF